VDGAFCLGSDASRPICDTMGNHHKHSSV
jgi:hypothetical protein